MVLQLKNFTLVATGEHPVTAAAVKVAVANDSFVNLRSSYLSYELYLLAIKSYRSWRRTKKAR